MSETPAPKQAPNRVTIVIPVYGDWASLRSCVQSLIDYADPTNYDVLLVNDCGPEADEIEAGLRGMIFGRDNFRYERNPENLGFVRTCNRAAYELDQTGNDILLLNSDTQITHGALDEMRDVLYLSERHAVVCPRSNDATIATIPFFQREQSAERDAERTRTVFAAISAELPRYYIAPVAIGFCFLIRRSLIDNHGLFDEIFGKGYNEENDFCLRLNALGYSSLIANHALVFHIGSTSFGSDQRAALEAANSRVLHARYPFYPETIVAFIRNEYTAVDRFSDLLVPSTMLRPPKVLIDLQHLALTHDGSTRNAVSFLEHVATPGTPDGENVVITARRDAVEFFDLERYGFDIIEPDLLDEVFDLGISIAPVTEIDQLIRLNRFCLRWVVSYLDIIALRSWEMRSLAPAKPVAVLRALQLADRVIAISHSSIDDAVDYFQELADERGEHERVIHQGAALPTGDETAPLSDAITPEDAAAVTAGGYVLVLGNRYPHKQVAQAVATLEGAGVAVIALGNAELRERFPWAHVLPGGALADDDLKVLYARAGAIVFPSAYEGFGLPLAEAAQHGKRVVAFDTVVAREVVDELGLSGVTFFDLFSALPETVRSALDDGPLPRSTVRTIEDYNAELWQAAIDTAHTPVDHVRLDRRDRTVRDLALVWEPLEQARRGVSRENAEIMASTTFRIARVATSAVTPLRRVLGRGLRVLRHRSG